MGPAWAAVVAGVAAAAVVDVRATGSKTVGLTRDGEGLEQRRRELLEMSSEVFGHLTLVGSDVDELEIFSCFYGVGMKTCLYDEDASSAVGDVDLSGVFADFSWEAVFTGETAYCLECCSNRRLSYEHDETLVLKCDMSQPRDTVDGRSRSFDIMSDYDYEFRFARRQDSADTGFVSCQLARTDASKKVVGYELTLHVVEHDQVLSFWRGVSQCEATAIESNDPDILGANIFEERLRLVVGAAQHLRVSASVLVLCAIIAVI